MHFFFHATRQESNIFAKWLNRSWNDQALVRLEGAALSIQIWIGIIDDFNDSEYNLKGDIIDICLVIEGIIEILEYDDIINLSIYYQQEFVSIQLLSIPSLIS